MDSSSEERGSWRTAGSGDSMCFPELRLMGLAFWLAKWWGSPARGTVKLSMDRECPGNRDSTVTVLGHLAAKSLGKMARVQARKR